MSTEFVKMKNLSVYYSLKRLFNSPTIFGFLESGCAIKIDY